MSRGVADPAVPAGAGTGASPATRSGGAAARRRMSPVLLGVVLGAALVIVVGLSLTLGAAALSPAEVWSALMARLGGTPVDPLVEGIVWDLRMPRILTAALVGAGLGVAGVVMQAVTRNPLADPYLLGLSSGASFGAVAVLLAGLSFLLPVAAFIGALIAAAAALGLAAAMGGLTPSRTVLAGVAVSAFAAALTSFVVFWFVTGDSYREVLSWLLGSVAGARWPEVSIAAVSFFIAGLPLLMTGRLLDAFAFGDTSAAALGLHVPRTRWLMLGLTALLTGGLVSVSGSIGFVGLVLPHAVRLLVGPGHRALLPLSALAGGVFLVLADTIARTVFDPRELPVGVITALVGAPVFALLLLRARKLA